MPYLLAVAATSFIDPAGAVPLIVCKYPLWSYPLPKPVSTAMLLVPVSVVVLYPKGAKPLLIASKATI